MIKKFVTKTLIFTTLFLVILIVVLLSASSYVKNKGFKNSQTESNTLMMKSNEKFDLMFMGISHARNFSRYGNHEIVENILQKKIINIGQGGGNCGINEQLFYLEYFYSKGNKVNTIALILTPPMITSETLPISSNTFNAELFDLDFFWDYLQFDSENKQERIMQYMQSKLKRTWIDLQPDKTIGKKEFLEKIDVAAVRKGMEYSNGYHVNMERFNNSCLVIEKIIKRARENKTEVVLIIPPALFGKWPEHNFAAGFAQKMKTEQNISFYDFSESVFQAKYYYDHHHLNTEGIKYFTDSFLKPAFKIVEK